MGKERNINTTHLKQGNCYPDPVPTAKVQETHWSHTANHVEISETKPSNPSANDVDNPKGWTFGSDVARKNSYTGPGGSKRD